MGGCESISCVQLPCPDNPTPPWSASIGGANPPFGGEEERGIQGNFPEDKQTAETALLFLQLITRKLRRSTRLLSPSLSSIPNGGEGGRRSGAEVRFSRAAVVVPNGTLFGDGVCARIKEELLKEFNLHTIIRLRNGVFAPYTSIPTNLLFFDRSGPTREVWYYEQPLPEGRKNYTKTAPIQFEELAGLIKWWGKAGQSSGREEDERAWRVGEIRAGPATEQFGHVQKPSGMRHSFARARRLSSA